MRRVYRSWLDTQFATVMREVPHAFEEIKPMGRSGMAKGRAYRQRQDSSRFFIVLRYQSDRPRAFLSFAWGQRDTVPSDALHAETVAALRAAQPNEQLFQRATGWLECGDWAGWPVNDFEPAQPSLSDPEITRFGGNPAVREFWDVMGVPADPVHADRFLRENVLTWDSVGDIAPELVTDDDCGVYLGDVAQQLRQALAAVVLPAARCWHSAHGGSSAPGAVKDG